MKKRFSKERIIRILQEAKAKTIDELCREHGVSKGTFYARKNKFDGMTISDAQRLRLLEAENSKLKRLVGGFNKTFIF